LAKQVLFFFLIRKRKNGILDFLKNYMINRINT
jgi:hypothetical protein